MLKSFVEKIQELAFDKIEINERTLTTKKLYPVLDPLPIPLEIHTLTGILDYNNKHYTDSAFVHVRDYNDVSLVGQIIGAEQQRTCYVQAQAYEIKHRFGVSMPLDEFVVYVQSMFVQDETTAAILRVVGNIVQGAEAEYVDDGITQRVTARTGVARREHVDLPNPVTLRPYRTFPDIEQPASQFVLRVKAGQDGQPPCCLLVEADGGAWKNQAIASIKAFFASHDVIVVG